MRRGETLGMDSIAVETRPGRTHQYQGEKDKIQRQLEAEKANEHVCPRCNCPLVKTGFSGSLAWRCVLCDARDYKKRQEELRLASHQATSEEEVYVGRFKVKRMGRSGRPLINTPLGKFWLIEEAKEEVAKEISEKRAIACRPLKSKAGELTRLDELRARAEADVPLFQEDDRDVYTGYADIAGLTEEKLVSDDQQVPFDMKNGTLVTDFKFLDVSKGKQGCKKRKSPARPRGRPRKVST